MFVTTQTIFKLDNVHATASGIVLVGDRIVQHLTKHPVIVLQ